MVIDELVALLGYDLEGEENLNRFQKGIDDLQKKAGAFAATLGRTLAVAGAAMAGGFLALGKGVIETSAEFESYGATLETIEGSAEKAKAALDWVGDFATKTPYDVAQVTEAFVRLRSYGIDPMDGSLSAMGDTASAMGKNLMQAVEAWADAMTGQFERLKEFGITSETKGNQVTFAWTEGGKQMSKTVKKTGADIKKFLDDTLGRRFSGAMVRQSKTWKGLWSNLGDAWTNFKRRIGDAGFFETAKRYLAELLDTVDAWARDGRLEQAAKALSGAFIATAEAIRLLAGRFGTHLTFIAENFDRVKPYLQGFGVALAVLMATTFPVISAMLLLGAAFEDFMTYLEGGESVIGSFIQGLQQTLGVGEDVAQQMAAVGAAIIAGLAGALLFSPGLLIGAGLRLVGFLAFGLVNGMALLSGVLLEAFLGLFAGLSASGLFATLGGTVSAGIAGALAFLATPAGWAVLIAGVGAAIVAYFWDDIVAAAPKLASAGAQMGAALLEGLMSIGGQIADWFAGLVPEWALGLLSGGNSRAAGGAGKNPLPGAAGTAPNSDAPAPDNVAPRGNGGAGASVPDNVTPRGRGGALSPDRYMRKGEAQGEEPQWLRNFNGNLAKMEGAQATQTVVNDSSQDNRQYPVTVSAPVTVSVQQATQAPAAVGNAVSRAIDQGVKAQPSRMQQGPVQ